MKLNEHQAVSAPKCLLVPYSVHHVSTYHEWMQDPELQEITASEPLTLDEEYGMQRTWHDDRDKLTFIICLPLHHTAHGTTQRPAVRPGIDDAPLRMIGDVNLFLSSSAHDNSEDVAGEVSLMIARPELRGQGYGRAALKAFIYFILTQWDTIYAEYADELQHPASGELKWLWVKVHESNVASKALFESVGFRQHSDHADVFGELELR
ncbi:hypothetical protein BAUCODRAFT_41791, partial [Baudoinia panamericana UAMH 10762]